MASPLVSDDPLQSPQLTDGDFAPRPLPKVRHGSHDGAPSALEKETAVGDVRPALPHRSATASSQSVPTSARRQASTTQLFRNEHSPASMILRAFAPHVSVLSSPDCEEILRHKGIHGGLLELLRPYGERVPGRVIIRDSTGASKPWEGFGIRFIGVNDGLVSPRSTRATQEVSDPAATTIEEYRPARLRSGGELSQIDQVVEAYLDHEEAQSRLTSADGHAIPDSSSQAPDVESEIDPAAYALYLRRIMSGSVSSPHETFSHPVAQVIAISSRSTAPIEELRNLYTSAKTGPDRPPPWINNEFLRYYVLVHDEDFDDIKKSTILYEQMKRHFGLHCHLLRLRSTQCLSTDDGSVSLPVPEWASAAEELADVIAKDTSEDPEEQRPCVFESDVSAVQSFVREMVAQSIVPVMERMVATWNDQVASRRRGLSGRFMSLSKRFTPFGGRNSPIPGTGGPAGNYDTTDGSYKPDAPEAIMRKLADYALMLRDYKLAQSTYEMIIADYKSDKAWKYYAGANEMSALTMLINSNISTSSSPLALAKRTEVIDGLLENAYYSYSTRSGSPFHAIRSVMLSSELLTTDSSATWSGNANINSTTATGTAAQAPARKRSLDEAIKWLTRILDDRTAIGPAAHALLAERIAVLHETCNDGLVNGRDTSVTTEHAGLDVTAAVTNKGTSRLRKAAFWRVLAAVAFGELDKVDRARRNLGIARASYTALADRGLQLGSRTGCGFDAAAGFVWSLDRTWGAGAGVVPNVIDSDIDVKADLDVGGEMSGAAGDMQRGKQTADADAGQARGNTVSSSITAAQQRSASPEPDEDGFV